MRTIHVSQDALEREVYNQYNTVMNLSIAMIFAFIAMLTGAIFLVRRPGGIGIYPFGNYLLGFFCLWAGFFFVEGFLLPQALMISGYVLVSCSALFLVVDFGLRFTRWLIQQNRFGKNPIPSLPDYAKVVCRAMDELAKRSIGALVVIEGKQPLEPLIRGGMPFDADIREEIFLSIFSTSSPIHDGALLIRQGRIKAVKVILPSSAQNIPLGVGTRHRAAIGITERTDAIALVVSEERGKMSLAYRGVLVPAASLQELYRLLHRSLARKKIKAAAPVGVTERAGLECVTWDRESRILN
ncbi:MAG: DNA integrity scanning protein DisA nucleotide-binding domain protein [Candidatus Omnitrophica bacterium]|nr:DNA integrity scanning protein DisA nucleotide-binding domain protein [Candidatus Omnitrophota bacterium]